MTLSTDGGAYWIASRTLRGRDAKPSDNVAIAALRSMAHQCLHAALRRDAAVRHSHRFVIDTHHPIWPGR